MGGHGEATLAVKLSNQATAQLKFLWSTLVIQVVIIVIYFWLLRYDKSADIKARHGSEYSARVSHGRVAAGHAKDEAEELEKKIEMELDSFPLSLDVLFMLFGGFGFLMTFLRRYGLSSVGFTMIMIVLVTEMSVIYLGLLLDHGGHGEEEHGVKIDLDLKLLMESFLVSASILISFGAIIGRVNLLQLLIMCMVETIVVCLNCYIVYTLLLANDVGGAIALHTCGAYFGLACSLTMDKLVPFFRARLLTETGDAKKKLLVEKYEQIADNLEDNRYTSDLFSLIGTVVLWIFWPSFNAFLAYGDARHRAVINTLLSLCGSTVATFVVSGLMQSREAGYRLPPEDVQNAVLAGGVMVGSTADMMLQPAGACLAGTIAGTVSSLGFNRATAWLQFRLGLRDTCGVHNLHGMPGVMSGLLSALVVALVTEDQYGPGLYLLFPACAPVEIDPELKAALPDIEPGLGRSIGGQALIQLAALGSTLLLSLGTGALTGVLMSLPGLADPLPSHAMFNDEVSWIVAESDDAGYQLALTIKGHGTEPHDDEDLVDRMESKYSSYVNTAYIP